MLKCSRQHVDRTVFGTIRTRFGSHRSRGIVRCASFSTGVNFFEATNDHKLHWQSSFLTGEIYFRSHFWDVEFSGFVCGWVLFCWDVGVTTFFENYEHKIVANKPGVQDVPTVVFNFVLYV